jgi:hypothetical protein
MSHWSLVFRAFVFVKSTSSWVCLMFPHDLIQLMHFGRILCKNDTAFLVHQGGKLMLPIPSLMMFARFLHYKVTIIQLLGFCLFVCLFLE